jgi:hypothetical protein
MKKNRLIIGLALVSCPFLMGQNLGNKTNNEVSVAAETKKKHLCVS